MERKMTITISGRDNEQAVNIAVDFDPPATDEPINSGFNSLAHVMLNALHKAAGAAVEDDA